MDENNINATPPHTDQIVVSIADIKAWLKTGVTRRVGDPGYSASIGSVQEKYGMSKAEVSALFQDSRLKGLKVSTPKPSRIIIAEDIVEDPIPSSEPAISGGDGVFGAMARASGGDVHEELPVHADADASDTNGNTASETLLGGITSDTRSGDIPMETTTDGDLYVTRF